MSGKNGQATLTRSFTALLYANLLNCDGNPNSSYYQALSSAKEKYLLDKGLTYKRSSDNLSSPGSAECGAMAVPPISTS